MTTSLTNATEREPSATTTTAPTALSFADLPLSEPVLRALEDIGYSEPTPVQVATYPVAVSGKDVIVQARTGTGKTAAFGIPLVDKLVSLEPYVQALVLAPTRELAVQSQREIARLAQHKGLRTAAIYGGAPMGRQIEELQSGAQIVSGTPGRVLDHLRRGTLEPSRLKVLVLDEMDEMLSMGFAKELNAILELIPPRERRQTMCFSATVDGEVRRHAERHMHDPEMISLSSDGAAAVNITHQVYMVTGRDRVGDLVHVLEVEDPESAIIFCNMRSETERVATGLKQAGFNADWLNGDLPQRDRERIMASTREGRLRYLVCTDVAARGIDISHLTHVINFTFPESAAVYVHRTGRTGRAGRTGCAVSLVGPEELGRLYYLRLEYKISPIERSLPTSGERKTRQEIDRIGLLEAAIVEPPNAADLAVARRLLTHPDGERILAGLLHTFFGIRSDVDDEAAAARRSKLTPSAPSPRERDDNGPEHDAPWRGPRDREPRNRGRDRERAPMPAAGPAIGSPAVGSNAGRNRPPRERERDNRDGVQLDKVDSGPNERNQRSERGPRRGNRTPAPNERAPEQQLHAAGDFIQDAFREPETRDGVGAITNDPNALEPSRRRERDRDREPRRQRTRAFVPNGDSPAAGSAPLDGELLQPLETEGVINGVNGNHGSAEDDAVGEQAAHLAGLLYLNLGKRDGVRVGEVARLLRDSCELSRGEIGRIRVRDRYTFVDVPEERLDTIISTLSGQVVHDKALAPERAKTAKT